MDQLKTNLLEFLNVLFSDLFNGFIEIRAFHKEAQAVKSIFCRSIKELMAQQATLLSTEYSIYFGVCPRKERIGNKGSVNYLWALWVDLDAKDFPGGKNEAMERIKSFPIPPTIVVDSGNGFHVYWRLKEPFEIKGPEDIVKIEAYLKTLAETLGADLAAAEIARILRLPGTLNHKDPQSPKRVSILEHQSDQQCNLADFDSILAISPLPDLKKNNPSGGMAEAISNMRQGNCNVTFARLTGRMLNDRWTPEDIYAVLEPLALRHSFSLERLRLEIKGICSRYPTKDSFPISKHNIGEIEIKTKPFIVIPLQDFLSGIDEKIEWVIDGILPAEGVGILAGPAGYGKSWMLIDLAIECACGGSWLGKFKATRNPVLYIDEESSCPLWNLCERSVMPKSKPIYYWDSNVFIAWLKNEKLSAGDMNGVIEIAEKVNKNEAILITSQLLNIELLPCKMPAGTMDIIQRFFKRRNAQIKPVDGRVSKVAQEIRNVHTKLSPNDAVHLATAIYYEADQFHTFDDGGKDGMSLLSLNGNVGGHPLVICKPPFSQYRLSL